MTLKRIFFAMDLNHISMPNHVEDKIDVSNVDKYFDIDFDIFDSTATEKKTGSLKMIKRYNEH